MIRVMVKPFVALLADRNHVQPMLGKVTVVMIFFGLDATKSARQLLRKGNELTHLGKSDYLGRHVFQGILFAVSSLIFRVNSLFNSLHALLLSTIAALVEFCAASACLLSGFSLRVQPIKGIFLFLHIWTLIAIIVVRPLALGAVFLQSIVRGRIGTEFFQRQISFTLRAILHTGRNCTSLFRALFSSVLSGRFQSAIETLAVQAVIRSRHPSESRNRLRDFASRAAFDIVGDSHEVCLLARLLCGKSRVGVQAPSRLVHCTTPLFSLAV